MKQVFFLVLLGLLYDNAVQANDNELIDDINIHGMTKGVAPSGRIVNGVPVSIENYKFAVSLRIDDQYFCGESIISVSHVLSAAHCVYPFLKNISRVSTGRVSLIMTQIRFDMIYCTTNVPDVRLWR